MRSRVREDCRQLGEAAEESRPGPGLHALGGEAEAPDQQEATAGLRFSPARRRVVIIGYGNVMRTDDALGRHVAEALSSSGDWTALALHQLNPETAEIIAGADVVVFVDAATDGEFGAIRCRRVSTRADATNLAHHVTPAAIMRLSRELFGATPEAYEISMRGRCFDLGDHLSPALAADLPSLITFVRELAVASLASAADTFSSDR